MRTACSVIVASWLCAVTANAAGFKDINGQLQQPLEQKDKAATVLIFVTTDCPVANKSAPEIERIYEAYRTRKVAFYLVHVDPQLTEAAARDHAKSFGYHCPILIDRQHQLVKYAGATVTPEAAVLSPEGKVLYRGRVNNLQEDYGKKRGTPTRNDLREALDAILAGQPVLHPVTRSIGCYIPDLPAAGK